MKELPIIESPYPEAFTINQARYAKGKYTVCMLDSVAGFKGDASYAADEVNAKWVHRGGGYQMTPTMVRKFIAVYEKMKKTVDSF